MTHVAHPARGRATLTAAVSLLLASLFAVAGASAAAAQETPEPELTWAPLVTLPPIVAPSVLSPAELGNGYTLGDPEAPVAIEVWEDFQCPFCQRFALQVKPVIVEQFVESGMASLTFRNLAFLGDESHWAAVAADLAAEQDLFWPFHDYLFANLLGENVGSYDLDRLLAMGEAAGLDMDVFRAGLVLDQARERFSRIEADARQDAGALGISSTPSLVLDGQKLEFQSFEEAIAAIEAAVAAAEATDAEAMESESADASEAPAEPAEPAASPGG
jgi:protein-disulfide isomerase